MRHLLARLRQFSAARFVLLVLLIVALAVAAVVMPRPHLAHLRHIFGHAGAFTPLAAVLVGALLLLALVPRTVVTLAFGALFGVWTGSGYTLVASAVAAAAGFGIGRLLGRDFIRAQAAKRDSPGLAGRVRTRVAQLDGWMADASVLGVITVRLLPAGYGLVSYAYGTSATRLRPYLAGSLIGAVPAAVGYAAIGAAVTAPGSLHWLAVAPLGLGLAASSALLLRWRLTRKTAHSRLAAEPEQP